MALKVKFGAVPAMVKMAGGSGVPVGLTIVSHGPVSRFAVRCRKIVPANPSRELKAILRSFPVRVTELIVGMRASGTPGGGHGSINAPKKRSGIREAIDGHSPPVGKLYQIIGVLTDLLEHS